MSTNPSLKPSFQSVLVTFLVAALLPVLAGTTTSSPALAAPPGAPGSIALRVLSARSLGPAADGFVQKDAEVQEFKWLINADDTGDPGTIDTKPDDGVDSQLMDKCLPVRRNTAGQVTQTGSEDPGAACPWPSIRQTAGTAPIIAQGTKADLTNGSIAGLPPGKYLISVLADGFKIDGQHFTVVSGSTVPVTVRMNPTPLPLSTIRIQVFNDTVPVDGTWEQDAEAGISGFSAHLTDVFGEVSTDYYGNPLCTTYEHVVPTDPASAIAFADGAPVVASGSTGRCVSDNTGEIVIPNLGPNRYAATVTPPANVASQWAQTTTLEGAKDWDIWIQEGETGYDNEVLKGGEQVPMVQFGFAKRLETPAPTSGAPTGSVTGVVERGLPYIGGENSNALSYETGFPNTATDGPIPNPWVALSALSDGDQAVYVGRGAADGSFRVERVPDGTYQLTVWDENQDFILWSFNVEVRDGKPTDVGNKEIVGWFTHLHGHVFIDDNENGKRDPGEESVPQFPLSIRERDNSLMDQYTNTASTDANGAYDIREVYPLGKWLVLEAFSTRYQTTGVTYRGENEKTGTTKLGGLVDLDFLPIIGLGGEVDWGVKPYAAGTNGGIAGTVSYDTTRNELDPAQAASEGYQPGIPDLTVNLYASVPCPADWSDAQKADACRQGKQIVPLSDTNNSQRGAFVKSTLLANTVSETWAPPKGCTAYDYKGRVLTDQLALPEFGEAANRGCLEAPMMGVAAGPSDKTEGDAGQTVNGNYGFGDGCFLADGVTPGEEDPDPTVDTCLTGERAPLPGARDYLVTVDIPDNPVGTGKMYKATAEESVNVFDGDAYLPQENIAHLTAAQADAPPPGLQPSVKQPPSQTGGIVSECGGPLHTVHVTNENFLAGEGSPFEGQDRPDCATKLITVRNGQATAPNFNLYTEVPIPTHFWGVTLDDLGLTFDRRSVNFGEAKGLPYVPVGLYDYAGRLLDTVHTDFNGLYEGLEPSTGTYNCPLPAGPCPNMYRFVGNDPGAPGHLNQDYNPGFRTIAASFQAWPGLYTVTDEAPTKVANVALAPGSTVANPTQCDLGGNYPQVLNVDQPVVRRNNTNGTARTAAQRTVVVTGLNFGASAGTRGRVTLGGTTVPVSAANWTDTKLTFEVATSISLGAQPLVVTNAGGFASYNGLTLQVVNGSGSNSPTNPRVVEVAPNTSIDTVQKGIEAARPTNSTRYTVVLVRPNTQSAANPRGEYTENVILHDRIRLQGSGPGGFLPDGTYVGGSVIDGLGFNPDNQQGQDWIDLLGTLSYSGNPEVPTGAVVTVLNPTGNNNEPSATGANAFPVAVNGFKLTGGVQLDFPTNLNTVTGGTTTPYGATGALVTQGGGVYVHNSVQNLQISDNVIQGNSGSYGGGVRVGTPYENPPGTQNNTANNNAGSRNTGLVLTRNQIRDNGGTNLAGGVGIFGGSNGYAVTGNAICGNYSAEYGGAITSFGYQGSGTGSGGRISGNRIWFNGSYDEGGGVMVAGELPSTPTGRSHGTGPVSIDHNVISSNLADDDGGGIRLLQVSGDKLDSTHADRVLISNNTVVNNVSAHEGGGIALDDAVFVDVVHNTVARNLTTATAITSDGTRAPAGLSTTTVSAPLASWLGQRFPGSPVATAGFSKPTLLNDLFWDNRAGTSVGGIVTGIGKLPTGFDGGTDHWDVGMTDIPVRPLTPVGTVLQTVEGTNVNPASPGTNVVTDTPGLVKPYELTVDVIASRTFPAFRQSVVIAELLPPNLMGDYHLAGSTSPAYGLGAGSTAGLGTNVTVSAPADDIDGDPRPRAGSQRWDSGSDQLVAAAAGAAAPALRGLATPFAARMLAPDAATPPVVDPPVVDPPVVTPPVVTPPVVTPPVVTPPVVTPPVVTPPVVTPPILRRAVTRLAAQPARARTTRGHRVTLLATISPQAQGRVAFSQGVKALCTARIRSGTASCTTSKRLPRGLHRVVVTYRGSTTQLPSVARTRFRIT